MRTKARQANGKRVSIDLGLLNAVKAFSDGATSVSDAIRNADSWAFFCADCGGMLTDGERNQALKII